MTELIAVCMATFEPDLDLFQAQVDSLRAQTDSDWTCVISDDSSAPAHFARIEAVLGDDRRFSISRAEARAGFYRNFERALRSIPEEAGLVALCDQDDRWHTDKLAVLRGALGTAGLVYSDQRLVDAEGRVLRDTLWKGRANNHTSLASMLVANTVTGAAALIRREIAELALPFPETPGFQFHDHWLGALALAAGELAYVDRPLYDYVQHAGAVFGDVTAGSPRAQARSPWPAHYFYGYVPRRMYAEQLLDRCEGRLTSAKRRTLERFASCETSAPALAWLAARPLRMLTGRTETLGSEIGLVKGILWRRLRPGAGDAVPPPLASYDERRMRRWRAQLR